MDYISEIFTRMDLRQVCSFLLNGVEDYDIDNRDYKEKLEDSSNPIYKRLENIYQDEIELDKAVADLSNALTAYEVIYTEIGMKFGARIIFQLLMEGGSIQFGEEK